MPAAPALAIIIGTRRGETRSGPFSLYTPTGWPRSRIRPRPWRRRRGLGGIDTQVTGRADSLVGGHHGQLANRSNWRTSFGPNQSVGS